jgi:hypothetical protein
MAPVLTTALAALRRDLNARFPNRDKTTDGWIGDAAHRAGTSGHNPDDTSGSRAEYSDADTKQEVRALDVDEDLREPGTTMRDVILGIIATPGDRRRMRYMIYQDKIWSRNTDWEPRPYSGDYHHHGHFSGDPDTDEDGSPWTSLLTIGGAAMAGLVDNAERAVTAFYTGQDPVPFPAPWDAQGDAAEGGGYPNPWVRLERKVDRLQETVDALLLAVKALSVPAVDQEQVDAAVLQALESVRFDTRVVLPG